MRGVPRHFETAASWAHTSFRTVISSHRDRGFLFLFLHDGCTLRRHMHHFLWLMHCGLRFDSRRLNKLLLALRPVLPNLVLARGTAMRRMPSHNKTTSLRALCLACVLIVGLRDTIEAILTSARQRWTSRFHNVLIRRPRSFFISDVMNDNLFPAFFTVRDHIRDVFWLIQFGHRRTKIHVNELALALRPVPSSVLARATAVRRVPRHCKTTPTGAHFLFCVLCSGLGNKISL
mmetsp:Transcript_8438/g.23474  ORF Transcript_8438/g.23474 Transcript_8438/m.23474 type:complete len:233 (+) Transcript_8438:242-940(+)